MHVLHTFSNCSSVPYMSWFAKRAHEQGSPRYSFILMHHERPRMIDEMEAYGFKCIWIKYSDQHRKLGILKALPLLWWHILRLRPDVVHSHLFDDSLPAMIAAWAARVKVRAVTKQWTGIHWLQAPQWVWTDKLINRLGTHLIAVSGECGRFMVEQEGARPEKIHLVHHGIDPGDETRVDAGTVDQLRRRFRTEGRFPVIGTVARMIEWKGHRPIVDAAQAVVQRHPQALFLFCGKGELEQDVRNYVEEKGLTGHILFTGPIPRPDMPSFYSLLDIYLHAAQLEPFGFVYPEAMMNAIPVVTTPTGAAGDAIQDGESGILVERNGPAIAAGIERALQADRKAMGQAGKEAALLMFRFDNMWNGTMEVYRKALGNDR
ncbi:MAG TPA: glycosyltransferase family 4 protein [Flavobacteriales bacterium]|nr:glycosyltransferase family 4 protein [Flavobacteriales bacterium]